MKVLIATYNEAGSIGRLVRELRARGAGVYVVDDWSPDGTGQIARNAGASVLTRLPKSGLASAYIDALKHSPFSHVVTMDAGGTHTTGQAEALYARRFEADIILAQRRFHGLSFRASLSWFCGLFFRRHGIHDATCGLRCYNVDKIKPLLRQVGASGHVFQAEILYHALSNGLTVATMPIPYTIEADSKVKWWEIVEALCILPRLLWFWLFRSPSSR